MNPKERTALLDQMEQLTALVKKCKKPSTDQTKLNKRLRALQKSLAGLKSAGTTAMKQDVFKTAHKQGYNHLKSILQFQQEEGYIESDMLLTFRNAFAPHLKAVYEWLDEQQARAKKEEDADKLQKEVAASIIEQSAEFTSSLPKPKKKAALVRLPVVAPFSRFFANEQTFKSLGIDHSYLGDGNNSDYVILNDQFVLAIKSKVYKEKGQEALDAALNKLSEKLGCEVALVEETPVRQASCVSHLFFWVMEAPRVDYLRGNIKFGDLEWGLAL
ncbi:hypothetical protein GR11A_00042 [Vibrio phage vB_VcorM_GR11A]|nr:hypothetical protein GR11A_00042 [Vibrio phage vB_VcorM_GR11A]